MPDVAGSRSGVRRRRAREAVLAVAADLGVDARHATILEDWNNTIIRLAPAQIVAKVGTSHFRDARLESLERELAVAKHLASRNAPVVRPTEDVPRARAGLIARTRARLPTLLSWRTHHPTNRDRNPTTAWSRFAPDPRSAVQLIASRWLDLYG
jgi:hypothetical protein